MLINLSNITKSFKGQIVLQNVDFVVNEGEKIGLVGLNGVGKTTLLNIIAGEIPFDNDTKMGVGDVFIKKGAKIGYLKQVEALQSGNTLYSEIRKSFAEVDNVAMQMEQINNLLPTLTPSTSQYKTAVEQLDKLSAYYQSIDGYLVETNIKKVLFGMGFKDRDLNGVVDNLSGGEKTRFALAKLLCENPDILLLDEPTNHLDFVTRNWLEDYLCAFKGAVLTVSHDRYFLDKVVNSIVEVRDKSLYRYKGGYNGFIQQRQMALELQAKQYEKQQEEIAKMEEFVRKNLAASSSTNSVGSRVKALEKMERLQNVPPKPKDITLKFDYDEDPVKAVLSVKNFGVTVGDNNKLFSDVNLDVTKGEKIAIVGENGIGKTSFVKAILRQIPFDGIVHWGAGVKLGYFEQECKNLNLNRSVYDELCNNMKLATEYDIRSLLARVNIVGEDVLKKIGELSGANRSKVAFALLMKTRANVLILDEPTNHLDFKAMEGLDKALMEFSGTLILVSHDRYLLQKVPTSIVELNKNGFVSCKGNFDAYQKFKKQNVSEVVSKPDNLDKTKQVLDKKQQRIDRMEKNRAERDIELLENEIASLNEQLSAPEIMSDYKKILDLTEKISATEKKLDEVMEKWLSLQ